MKIEDIEDIEGIGAKYAEKMKGAEVHTTEDLLKKGGTAKGRAALAAVAQFTEKQVLEWVTSSVGLPRAKIKL